MVLLVPYDGSELSRTALARAQQYSELTDAELIALTVVPEDSEFAVERGWIDVEEQFDGEMIGHQLQEDVAEIAPAATRRIEVVEPNDDQVITSPTFDIVRTIRNVATEVGAEVLFLGSENAGQVSAPLTSVSEPLTEDPEYDVFIVRHPD